MRRGAGFDTDQTRRQLLKERQNIAPLQLTTDHHFAGSINAMNLKDRFGDVETDCRNLDIPPSGGSILLRRYQNFFWRFQN
jgi:hypothetical protein